MAGYNIPPLDKLTDALAALPGIGKKSAARLAYHITTMSDAQVAELTKAMTDAKVELHYCPTCQNLTPDEECAICRSDKRDRSVICVVEAPIDVIKLEKTRDYSGLYHVLHGVMSPIEGIYAEDIKLRELLTRLASGEVKEVIMATNPSIDGEATATYISRLIKPMGIKVSRLAYGIPIGGTLEYTDTVTLAKAMEGRQEI